MTDSALREKHPDKENPQPRGGYIVDAGLLPAGKDPKCIEIDIREGR